MCDFTETMAKKMVRKLIYEYSRNLNDDSKFTYLGLPGRRCLDINAWKENIQFAHCYEMDNEKYEDMQRRLHLLIPGRFTTYKDNIWNGLNNHDGDFIDLCNLDFYGGPSSANIPEISEFRSLANFFSYQRGLSNNRDFLIAWTLGVRNPNFDYYVEHNLFCAW